MADTVTLYCQIGDHKWERPRQRGRQPLNCPEHAPVKVQPQIKREPAKAAEAAVMETLICEVGNHEWQRERKRGKKPTCCPEHKPAVTVAEKPLAPVIDREAVETELSALEARKRSAMDEYVQALEATKAAKTKDEINHTFNAADNYQNIVLGILHRREVLQYQLQRAA